MSDDPLWYKDAVIYQLHVRAFADSNGDGIGDFRGLTGKLDYLQDLGVTALWLLPFYPSPMRDDGYDIADYSTVNPIYGTLADFKVFLREAHRRGLRVITELVINHTSDQHGWFQRARRAKPGSKWRDFYVWSETPERYGETRIIFKDFEASNWTWDPVAGAYFWHRFYHHQPDLNFDHPPVRQAVVGMLDHWLKMGVDGLRLDAIPYLYEREGTNCENLPETHEFLKHLRHHVEQRFPGRMLLAEANQWPEDAVAYFGDGDETHMAFHFPVMPRLYMGLHMEDRFPIVDILQQTPAIPDNAQWALFLRNHDELTLEMVTDEDRDYMYKVYAHDPVMRINLGIRRRLAPLLGNDRRRIELMNGLLCSLPGTPILYYGDEIGMGDNVYLGDRNGVRTPMQWSADRNAGFSRANPQRLYSPVIIDPEYHFEGLNVEAQQNNPHSLLWWMKRLIALRKRFKALGRGTLEFLHPENRTVLAFLRRSDEETLLVVVNLSRFAQAVELDLSGFRDHVPVEVFGQNPFPPIGDLPYFLTLAPHAFYWFKLEPGMIVGESEEVPELATVGVWQSVVDTGGGRLDRALRRFVSQARWFGGKARSLKTVTLTERVAIPCTGGDAELLFLNCAYRDGDPETYVVPLRYAAADRAEHLAAHFPHAVIARLARADADGNEVGVLYDGMADGGFPVALLEFVAGRRRFAGQAGALHPVRSRAFRDIRGAGREPLVPFILRAEQSNTSTVFGERVVMKLFRKLDDGINPDYEVGRFLTERTRFAQHPRLAAAVEYRVTGEASRTVALFQEFVPSEGDAWTYTLDVLAWYFDQAVTHSATLGLPPSVSEQHPLAVLGDPPPPLDDLLGGYLGQVELLARRTAELHNALGSREEDPAFQPEAFSALYQRSLYQASRGRARRALELLQRRLRELPETVRPVARRLLKAEDALFAQLHAVVGRKLSGQRIRTHGDYHLGQVLYTGRDFVIIDFEGEPARPISERRFKRTPLRDVAGMLRSYEYASAFALASPRVRPEDREPLAPWATSWAMWVTGRFVAAYREHVQDGLLPTTEAELRTLLDFYLLDKAVYELAYELNTRPEWVAIPLEAVMRHLGLNANQ